MQILTQPVDTTTKLWDYYYRARVPYLASRSVDDIRRHGTPVSGVKSIDKELKNQWTTTMMTVAQMVDYYKEGVAIRVCSESDIKEIYESISEHIHAWKARLERGINIGDAPIEDLINLDQFASTVYAHAKYHFTPDMFGGMFAQHMAGVQRINASNFFKSSALANLQIPDTVDGITRINAQEEQLPERDELVNFFKERLINLRRY